MNFYRLSRSKSTKPYTSLERAHSDASNEPTIIDGPKHQKSPVGAYDIEHPNWLFNIKKRLKLLWVWGNRS